MYMTPNERALSLYCGTLGAFLRSVEASDFDRSDHPWDLITDAATWLRDNNPIIRELCPTFAIESLPRVQLFTPDREPPIPRGRPDIVVNPLEFDREVRDEEFRSHRLPAGVVQSFVSQVKRVVNHGDKNLELLVFPHLYPHGRGQWEYRGRANLK